MRLPSSRESNRIGNWIIFGINQHVESINGGDLLLSFKISSASHLVAIKSFPRTIHWPFWIDFQLCFLNILNIIYFTSIAFLLLSFYVYIRTGFLSLFSIGSYSFLFKWGKFFESSLFVFSCFCLSSSFFFSSSFLVCSFFFASSSFFFSSSSFFFSSYFLLCLSIFACSSSFYLAFYSFLLSSLF